MLAVRWRRTVLKKAAYSAPCFPINNAFINTFKHNNVVFSKKKPSEKNKPGAKPKPVPRILRSDNPIRAWKNRLPEPTAKAKEGPLAEGKVKLAYIDEENGTAVFDVGGIRVEVPPGEEVEVKLGGSDEAKVRIRSPFEAGEDIAEMILRAAEEDAGELMKDYDVEGDWEGFKGMKKRKKDGED